MRSQTPNIMDIMEDLSLLFVFKPTRLKYRYYNLKNAPSSTGRGDVMARFIINALKEPSGINKKIGVILILPDAFLGEICEIVDIDVNSLDNLILITSQASFFENSDNLNNITQYSVLKTFYKSIENLYQINQEYLDRDLFTQTANMSLKELLNLLTQLKFRSYFLFENSTNSFSTLCDKIFGSPKKAFFIGDQIGFDEKYLKLLEDNCESMSIGTTAYLASSVIDYLKFKIISKKL